MSHDVQSLLIVAIHGVGVGVAIHRVGGGEAGGRSPIPARAGRDGAADPVRVAGALKL